MIGGTLAQHAKIVVYAPGCQFKAYNIDLDGTSDISEHFECDSLPRKTVHGFLPPAQIPSSIFPAEKTLAISGELEPDWVCDFFLQQRRGAAVIMAGSCLGAGIPLGRVGDLDPANGGAFEITIPDFTGDPLFKGTDEIPRGGNFGVIDLVIQDKVRSHQARECWPRVGPECPKRVPRTSKVHDGTMIGLFPNLCD